MIQYSILFKYIIMYCNK